MTDVYIGGWLVSDSAGARTTTAAVGPASMFIDGAAYNPAGRRHVVDSAVTNAFFISGTAHNASGAMFIDDGAVTDPVYIGGIAHTQAGARYVASTGTVVAYHAGLPLLATGAMLVDGVGENDNALLWDNNETSNILWETTADNVILWT